MSVDCDKTTVSVREAVPETEKLFHQHDVSTKSRKRKRNTAITEPVVKKTAVGPCLRRVSCPHQQRLTQTHQKLGPWLYWTTHRLQRRLQIPPAQVICLHPQNHRLSGGWKTLNGLILYLYRDKLLITPMTIRCYT